MQIQSSFLRNRFSAQQLAAPFNAQVLSHTQFYRSSEELHYHDCPECGICLRGSGLFFVEDRTYPFSAGTVTYLPSGMLHIGQSPRGHSSDWLFFWVDNDEADFPVEERLSEDRECYALTEILCHLIKRQDREETGYFHALCAALAAKLRLCGQKESGSASARRYEALLPALDSIARRYADDLTVEQLAAECHVSVSSLQRYFGETFGRSPIEYLTDIRITMAENLLRNTRMSVTQIAEECGFAVISTFNRQFLKHTGLSPTKYRQQTKSD